jgi:hypothetical protein
MVDLHTHSNISDGDLPPALLVKEAARQGLCALALTDHDSIKGLESAKAAAKEENIHFIPGIEVNINWKSMSDAPGLGPGGEFHLLGLGINSPSQGFISSVEKLAHHREARNRKILQKMFELNMTTRTGMDTAWEELKEIAGGESAGFSLGRPHFATLLVKRKIVRNINIAFARYLGVGKPLYVQKEGLEFDEAVFLIRESGGIPVLAHPFSLYIAWGRLPDLIKKLKDMGLMGLEAWHPTTKTSSCRRLEALAQSLGLYVTEGSDFHGSLQPNRVLGHSGKGRQIASAILEAIPELAP